jgi:hypothetical protein
MPESEGVLAEADPALKVALSFVVEADPLPAHRSAVPNLAPSKQASDYMADRLGLPETALKALLQPRSLWTPAVLLLEYGAAMARAHEVEIRSQGQEALLSPEQAREMAAKLADLGVASAVMGEGSYLNRPEFVFSDPVVASQLAEVEGDELLGAWAISGRGWLEHMQLLKGPLPPDGPYTMADILKRHVRVETTYAEGLATVGIARGDVVHTAPTHQTAPESHGIQAQPEDLPKFSRPILHQAGLLGSEV